MFSFLLAAAAANQVPFSKDFDLRCMSAYLVVAGDAQDDASIPAEDKAGMQAIVMYYLGKLYARRPDADLRSEVTNLVTAPGYSALLTADIERCSAEAEERGNYLSSLGDAPETGKTDPAGPTAAKP